MKMSRKHIRAVAKPLTNKHNATDEVALALGLFFCGLTLVVSFWAAIATIFSFPS